MRAVDELYVALRHGKIPVERYNGKMTTDEREKSQASFMQPGRKVVMLATNAFGLGIDKPDIRYIIHYQMPGSPEAYVQEAGRAGRDGKPARCVLLFQPDDIAIQEHFLKEAHPTKSQARMVAEGLYAWSDEGKEVSVRDLALSMALPERRVRVILSVLEAMGVAEEVKAARWKGVEPKPTREQIDKAASVFEARRISDRRRLASLLKYMNTQKCRVQMLRGYFGEPEGEKCGLCDSDAGLDSEVFDPGVGRRAARAARGDRLPRAPAAAPAGTRRRLRGAAWQRRRARAVGAAAAACSRRRSRATCCRRCRRSRFRRRPTASRPSTRVCGRRADAGAGEPMSGDAVVDLPTTRSEPTRSRAAADGAAPRGRRGFHHRLGGGTRRQHPAVRRVAAPARRSRCPCWRRGPQARRRQQRRPPWPRPRPRRHGGGGGGGGGDRQFRGGGPGGRFDGGGGGGGGRRRKRRGTQPRPRHATTTGAIIIVTATASAGRGFPAFTIRAATSVPALPGGD